MKTPASIGNHPLHPMLIAIPLGLWTFSLICDIAYLHTGSADWFLSALYTMGGGMFGAILAIVPGYIDFLSLKNPKPKKIAFAHMMTNFGIILLYIVNLMLRIIQVTSFALPFALSVVGVLLLGLSGWLGGELVYTHEIGVNPNRKKEIPTEEYPSERKSA